MWSVFPELEGGTLVGTSSVPLTTLGTGIVGVIVGMSITLGHIIVVASAPTTPPSTFLVTPPTSVGGLVFFRWFWRRLG